MKKARNENMISSWCEDVDYMIAYSLMGNYKDDDFISSSLLPTPELTDCPRDRIFADWVKLITGKIGEGLDLYNSTDFETFKREWEVSLEIRYFHENNELHVGLCIWKKKVKALFGIGNYYSCRGFNERFSAGDDGMLGFNADTSTDCFW